MCLTSHFFHLTILKFTQKEERKMKNININNNEPNNNEDMKYISMLCKEKTDLVLKTEFGIGRYKFNKFNELQGKMVLEFKLLDDNRYKDTESIYKNIGNICYLTIHQYLSVYSYSAQA